MGPGEKLINKERRVKYSLECPELVEYRKKNISERQRGSVNLDDHTVHTSGRPRKDKSLYPHNNVMSGDRLIVLLEKYGLKEKADKVWAVIKKGLNTYAPCPECLPLVTQLWNPNISSGSYKKVMVRSWTSETRNSGMTRTLDCMTWCLRCLCAGSAPHRTSLSMGVLIQYG